MVFDARRHVRRRCLGVKELPAHPTLQGQQGQSQLVTFPAFVKDVLYEATDFIDHVLDKSKGKTEKASPPADSKVKLLSGTFRPSEVPTDPRLAQSVAEEWFSRRSIHVNEQEDGTASFKELEAALLQDHAVREHEYTPDIFDAHKIADWEDAIAAMENSADWQEQYSQIRMGIYEMAHHLPWPCYNRAFAVLVLSARTSESSFIVVQIPVDVAGVPQALYSNGTNRDQGDNARKRKPVVLGTYASIERVTAVSDGRETCWEMATTSDAGGWLPLWLQRLALPAAIAKDVGFVVKWAMERRER